jgi:phenylacetate-CoA ligase
MIDFLAPITRHLIAPAWAAWERSPYLRHYRRLRCTQFEPSEAIRRQQWEKIESILHHAYATTRFYRLRLQDAGLEPGRICSFDDFRAVPLLTKADLRAHAGEMLSEEYWNEKESLHRKKTSGSTGVSVEVLVDEAAQEFKRAATLRSDEWSGWRLGERVAILWGAEENRRRGWRPWLRNALLERAAYLDTLRIDEQSMGRFVAALRCRPPGLLFGHAHSLYLLSQFVQARGVTEIRPHGIISAAMVLHDWERHQIEEVFQCPVTNRYGCEEVSLIACECERHEGLHINADGIYLEVLRTDGTPAEAGEPGMIVVTDLANRAMPIIRYEVGDKIGRASCRERV